MIKISNIFLVFGIFLLLLVIINGFTSTEISPSLQRAQTLSALSSVCLISVGILWQDISPKKPLIVNLSGKEGFELNQELTDFQKSELAWGSQLLLTASAASTILIYWEGKSIMKRGLISDNSFEPGEICKKAQDQQRLISLVNTKLFPGRYEFDSIIKDLPAVIVYPLGTKGWTVVGGWSIRSFTKSDEIWISGWSEKIKEVLTGKSK